MGKADYFRLGDYNAVCDECGFKYKASQLKRRWDGAMVCREDWEPRHPQDFVRGRPEGQALPYTRPEQVDEFAPDTLDPSTYPKSF